MGWTGNLDRWQWYCGTRQDFDHIELGSRILSCYSCLLGLFRLLQSLLPDTEVFCPQDSPRQRPSHHVGLYVVQAKCCSNILQATPVARCKPRPAPSPLLYLWRLYNGFILKPKIKILILPDRRAVTLSPLKRLDVLLFTIVLPWLAM